MSHSRPWVALAVLGAYHGLNPAMGWLFALALGVQEKRRSAVVGALLPITVGRAAAITAAILALRFVQHFLPMNILKWGVALFLFTLGVYRLFRANHPRGAGMRVGGTKVEMPTSLRLDRLAFREKTSVLKGFRSFLRRESNQPTPEYRRVARSGRISR